MQIIYSENFKEQYQKIKDPLTQLKVIKQIQKLMQQPLLGKPLKYDYKNKRSLRVKPYRIIYEVKGDAIILLMFDHRKHAYE